MARAPRIEYAGAIYHVMNRGDRLEPIYEDDVDRMIFMKTLAETCESSGWHVHSFVLMKNHYHLLIETVRPTLVKGMQYLNSTYTRRYNVRHKTFGHLFQGRYKALLVDVEAKGYFLTVSDYIHLNPVRSKKEREIKGLLKDPWSSAGWLAGSRKGKPDWLKWNRVYEELGMRNWKSRSRREYRNYLEGRIADVNEDDQALKKIRRGWCLGSESFVEKMKEMLEEMSEAPHERDSWTGAAVEAMEEDRAEGLLGKALKELQYQEMKLKGLERALLARWIRSRTKVGVKWLAQRLGARTAGGLSCGIWLVGEQLEGNAKLKNQWKRLNNID